MNDKSIEKVDQEFSPSGVANISFAEDAKKFKSLYQQKIDLEDKKTEVLSEIEDLLVEFFEIKGRSDKGLLEQYHRIEVYTPQKKSEKSDIYRELQKSSSGYHFHNLAKDNKVMKILEEDFGEELTAYFEEISDLYQIHNYASDKLLDESATKKLKKEYRKLVKKHDKVERELVKVNRSLSGVREYVSFAKDIAEITSIANKDNE